MDSETKGQNGVRMDSSPLTWFWCLFWFSCRFEILIWPVLTFCNGLVSCLHNWQRCLTCILGLLQIHVRARPQDGQVHVASVGTTAEVLLQSLSCQENGVLLSVPQDEFFLIIFCSKFWADYILIYTLCEELMESVGSSHCHSSWRSWPDTLWVTLTRLWLALILVVLVLVLPEVTTFVWLAHMFFWSISPES
jgi:hypothetical protein